MINSRTPLCIPTFWNHQKIIQCLLPIQVEVHECTMHPHYMRVLSSLNDSQSIPLTTGTHLRLQLKLSMPLMWLNYLHIMDSPLQTPTTVLGTLGLGCMNSSLTRRWVINPTKLPLSASIGSQIFQSLKATRIRLMGGVLNCGDGSLISQWIALLQGWHETSLMMKKSP